MLRDGVFERALEEAGARGECPVLFLPDFYTNHWDFWALCDGFECGDCVADFVDIGLDPAPGEEGCSL